MKKTIKNIIDYFFSLIWYIMPNNKYRKIKFIEDNDTIDKIVNQGKTMCRFGDGELKIMENVQSKFFQKNDEELSKRLKEVINCNNQDILIGLPIVFKDLSQFKMKSRAFWKIHMYRYRKHWFKYIDLKTL